MRIRYAEILIVAVLFVDLAFGQSAVSSGDAQALVNSPLPLMPRYEQGRPLYDTLTRHDVIFTLEGAKTSEHKSVSHFIRTRGADGADGRIREQFRWASFRWGKTNGPDEVLKTREVKEAQGWTLEFSMADSDLPEAADFSDLQRDWGGFHFRIAVYDAITFDGMSRPTARLPLPEEAPIGAEVKATDGGRVFDFGFPPLFSKFEYTLGRKHSARILGVSLVDDVKCAIVEFSGPENKFESTLNLQGVEVAGHGFEHFWGKTYLALDDGRILKGELVGPVTQVLDILIPGQEQPRRQQQLIMQHVTLELVSEQEFRLAAGGTRGPRENSDGP